MVPTTLTVTFFWRAVTGAVDFIRSLARLATSTDVAMSRSVPMTISLSDVWGAYVGRDRPHQHLGVRHVGRLRHGDGVEQGQRQTGEGHGGNQELPAADDREVVTHLHGGLR